MTDKNEKERRRIIEIIDERGEFVMDVDGYIYYWPQGQGCLAPHHLRWIADELDRRNKPWDDEINRYFSEKEQMDDPGISLS